MLNATITEIAHDAEEVIKAIKEMVEAEVIITFRLLSLLLPAQ